MIQTGLETGTARSAGQRLIHSAIGGPVHMGVVGWCDGAG